MPATATLTRPPVEDRRHGERRQCPIEEAAKEGTLDLDVLRAACRGEDPWVIIERAAGVRRESAGEAI